MPLYASDFGFHPWQAPYSAGDEVAIINCTLGGRFFFEGRAKVLCCRDDENALVQLSDGEKVERYIDPRAQHLSEDKLRDYIDALNRPAPPVYDTPSGHDLGCEELPPGFDHGCTCRARPAN